MVGTMVVLGQYEVVPVAYLELYQYMAILVRTWYCESIARYRLFIDGTGLVSKGHVCLYIMKKVGNSSNVINRLQT